MMHAPVAHSPAPHHPAPTSGGRLVTSTGRALPLLGTSLTADAAGGVARVTVEQRFHNPYAEPLAVTYTLPLPADGAVSGFSFRVGARRVIGEVDRKRAARERYEQALVEGKSAALLEQDRSSLFTQEIGNIPPGEEVLIEVSVDQRLRWLDEGAWEWRFPTVAAPRYLGEPGRVADAERVTQDVASAGTPARFSLSCVVRDVIAAGRRAESPSHAIDTSPAGSGVRLELRDAGGARLDRDVVLRWAVATPKVGLTLAQGAPRLGRGFGLCTIVPPSIEAGYEVVPRDVIVLLDTSGSMAGEPLAQAVRVVSAIVDTLREQDQLELVEFSSAARRWRAHPARATASMRADAIRWLKALRASGSTEMRAAIVDALSAARPEAQRQVVLVTDGLIGFESQVVQAICDRLPTSSRLHTVGVGSAVNRSLTGPAARAGHGVEVVLGLGEDPERAAARVVARTTAPLLVDLVVEGSALLEHAPSRLPDLFAGSPALVSVALRPEGGALVVRGRTHSGSWEQRVRVAPSTEGSGSPTVTALFGREQVEDLEMRLAAGDDARDIDRAIERAGIDFQISTRLTSWIAVSQEQTVDPGDPLRRERMPQELPHGMSAEGLGLRAARASIPAPAAMAAGIAFDLGAPAGAAPQRESRRLADGGRPKSMETWGRRPSAPMPRPGGMPPPAAAPMSLDEGSLDDMMQAPQGGSSDAFFGAPPPPPQSLSAPSVPSAPAASEPAAPRRGVLGALRDLVGGLIGKEREAPAPEEREEASAKAETPKAKKAESASSGAAKPVVVGPQGQLLRAGRVLRGRVVLQANQVLVVELSVEGAPLTWSPAGEAVVTLADGRTLTLTVVAARSTRAGSVVASGASARLTLALPDEAALDVAAIEIALGGDRVIIQLR
jgi:Ca-activated chloride channel family protein